MDDSEKFVRELINQLKGLSKRLIPRDELLRSCKDTLNTILSMAHSGELSKEVFKEFKEELENQLKKEDDEQKM